MSATEPRPTALASATTPGPTTSASDVTPGSAATEAASYRLRTKASSFILFRS